MRRGERRTAELACGGVAFRGVLRHRALNDVVERRGYVRVDLEHRRRWRVHMSPERRQVVLPLVRGTAGQSLEQDASKRVHVRLRRHGHPLDLLRRRVVHRAHPLTRPREAADRAGVLREAEVRQVDVVLGGDEDVRRLDVAMDQFPLVSGVQGARDLGDEMGSTLGLERAAIDRVAQVRPLHPAHRDEQDPVLLAGLVDRDHIRVIDRSGDHPFAPEPLAKRGVPRQRRRYELQRHRTREAKLARAVDDAHPASGRHLLDPVAGELRADDKLCCCVLPHSRSRPH